METITVEISIERPVAEHGTETTLEVLSVRVNGTPVEPEDEYDEGRKTSLWKVCSSDLAALELILYPYG